MGSRSGNVNMETSRTTVLDELKSFEKGGGGGGFLDLGHPLLNRIADSFITAAGIGALQAVSREAYFTAVEGAGLDSNNHAFSDVPGSAKRNRFPNLRGAGETNRKSLEAMVKNTGKESFQWGVAAGVYSGLTYGLKEARGSHDWVTTEGLREKNSAVAGAITGVALALTADESSHEQIVQCAFTGAAIASAANLLSGVF